MVRPEVGLPAKGAGCAAAPEGGGWRRGARARLPAKGVILSFALLGLGGGCAALLPQPLPFLGQAHFREVSYPASSLKLGHPLTGLRSQHPEACWEGRALWRRLDGERVEEIRRSGWRLLRGHLALAAEVFFSLPEVERVRLTYRGVEMEELEGVTIVPRDTCYRLLVKGYPVPVGRTRARGLEVVALDERGANRLPAFRPQDPPFAELLRRWGTPEAARGGSAWRWEGDLTVGARYVIPSIRLLGERSLVLSLGRDPEAELPEFGHRIRLLRLGGEGVGAFAQIQLLPLDGRFPTSRAPLTLGRFDDLALFSGDGSELVRLRPAMAAGGSLVLELARGRIELKPEGWLELTPALW